MNKRQVVVLWILAILLAAAAFFARTGHDKGFESKTQRARGQTLIADFPAQEVAKIQISAGENTATIVRKDGKWTVAERGNYPANATTINELLRTLAEVKVTQGIEAAPSFAPRFGMDPGASDAKDRGTEVVLYNDAGTELSHVTLGKNLESGNDPMSMMGMGGGSSGRFIRNQADASGVYVVSELFPTLSAEPKGWLNEDFVKVEKIKDISVSPAAKPDEVAWKVSREDENGEFKLEGAKPDETLDTAAATSLKSLLSYARFDDIVPEDKIEEIAKPLEKQTVKIETFEGFNYKITITPTEIEKPKTEEPNSAPPEDSFLLTVDVDATIPAERKKGEKESEEDAKTKDKAFTERKAELEKRLAAEKALAGRSFKVSRYTVEALLKDRAAILQKPATPAAAPAGSQVPGMLRPNGAPGSRPAAPPRRPVEAVTPPIAIPPLEEGGGDGAKEEGK